MDFLISGFRLFVFFSCLIGLSLLIYDKAKVKIEFAPILACGVITMTVYIAGILKVMNLSVGCLIILGVFSFFFYMFKIFTKRIQWREVVTPGILIYFLACLYFAVLIRNIYLPQFDNYTHWALMVKNMWAVDGYPILENALITYRQYPPGTATFLYFFTKITGEYDTFLAIGQTYLTLSAILPIFSFIKKERCKSIFIVLLLSIVFFLSSNIIVYDLSVDTILPLVGLSNTAVLIYYKNEIKKASILSIPLMLVTILIKNSGMIFAIFNIILMLWYTYKQGFKRYRLYPFISILICLLGFATWSIHTKLAFSSSVVAGSTHSMTLGYYSTMLEGRTMEDVIEIIRLFLGRMFDVKGITFKIMASWNITFIILYCIRYRYDKYRCKSRNHYLLIFNSIYLFYMIGVLAMYVFSMPLEEAFVLAAYGRYTLSILIYLIGVALIVYLQTYHGAKNRSVVLFSDVIISFTLVISILLPGQLYTLYQRPKYENTIQQEFDFVLAQSSLSSTTRCLIYAPSNATNYGYTWYYTRYRLMSTNFDIITSTNDELLLKYHEYDVFIILEVDEAITQLLAPYTNEVEQGIYTIAALKE